MNLLIMKILIRFLSKYIFFISNIGYIEMYIPYVASVPQNV